MKTLGEIVTEVANGHEIYTKKEVLDLLASLDQTDSSILEKVNRILTEVQNRFRKEDIRNFEFEFDFSNGRGNSFTIDVTNADGLIDEFKDRIEVEIDQLKNEVQNS